jgi:hypothetical protein
MGKLLPAIAGALVVGAVSLLGSQKKNAAPGPQQVGEENRASSPQSKHRFQAKGRQEVAQSGNAGKQ